MLKNNMFSELQKSQHSFFTIFHILLPLLAILVVKLYYINSILNDNDEFMTSIYYTLIACAFPIGVSLMVAISVSWEEENYLQRILAVTSRRHSWGAKLIMLYFYGFVSVLIAVIGGQLVLVHKQSILFLLSVVAVFAGTNLILYPLHMFLNFRFGKAISILVAFVGSVIGLVLLTGLGDACWQWIPYSMAERLTGYLVAITYGHYPVSQNQYYISEMIKAVPVMGIYVIILLFGTTVWFCKWEGRSIAE